jgi:hypothetical protein
MEKMMTKTDVVKKLVDLYAKYKDHVEITIYYDLEEKKLVPVIDRDERYLRSGAECECIVTYEQNWTNNCQLELIEFLDKEEIPEYFEFMKKKYTLDEYETEYVGNIDDIEEYITDHREEGKEDFYERLESYFEYYLEDSQQPND